MKSSREAGVYREILEGEQGRGREGRKDRERRGWGKWEEKEAVEIREFPQVSDPTL